MQSSTSTDKKTFVDKTRKAPNFASEEKNKMKKKIILWIKYIILHFKSLGKIVN